MPKKRRNLGATRVVHANDAAVLKTQITRWDKAAEASLKAGNCTGAYLNLLQKAEAEGAFVREALHSKQPAWRDAHNRVGILFSEVCLLEKPVGLSGARRRAPKRRK